MSRFRDFYRRNIYGVMGTLVFHILLVTSFLLSKVDIQGTVREKELIIDLTDMLLQEPEPVEEERAESSEETASQASSDANTTTNIASNRLAQPDDFFDQEYLNEVEAAQQLASNVSNQLAREIIDISEIKMPVDITEGIDPDSIKNVINTGKSNIVYYLENRHHISLPIPVYLAQGGGDVIVDISVNRSGRVVKATVRRSSQVRSEQVYLYAEAAALNTVFNTSPTAPEIQTGTIHYTFIAQ